MSTQLRPDYVKLGWLPVLLVCWPALSSAQVPVDSSGEPLGEVERSSGYFLTSTEDIPLLTAAELEELVGPIALYPDDLLAIVLSASAYPLQVAQAGRFLDDLIIDSSLQPKESWDDSVVALINYPEAVELLNDDLDWTWRLGEAVVAQQSDVIAAVEAFRDRAYAAGNLKSDDYQTVSLDDGIIEITPVEDDVIYVPYYEPESVVVYQTRPVYHYYPHAYPVYYYPYSFGHAFHHDFFWGVTTAFSVSWHTNSLHVYHHSYYGHPYYGHSYWDHWWYRSPSINVYNHHYGHQYNRHWNHDRYGAGDYWHPQTRHTVSAHDQRATRTRYYPSTNMSANLVTTSGGSTSDRPRAVRSQTTQRRNTFSDARTGIDFRDRPTTIRPTTVARTNGNHQNGRSDRLTTARPSINTTARRSDNQGSRTSQTPRRTTTSHAPSRQLESSRPGVRPSDSVSTARRQSSPRPQMVARQSHSRQSAPSRSHSRQSAPSQSHSRQSAPSQSHSRQSAPSQSHSRQSAPSQSHSRQSAPNQSQSHKTNSSSSHSRKAAGRRNDSSGSRQRH